jgi:DNA replication ATP-dependent helicase Dna2
MTKLNHTKHINLIYSELVYQTNEFNKLLKKQAAKMFVKNQLYLCRYQGFDEVRGNIIVLFDHDICLPPRKNEVLLCFISKMQDPHVKNWGGLTYEKLRSTVTDQFEAKTVFFTYEKKQTIVGLSGIKTEDVSKYKKNDLIFLAPNDPPLQYLLNLHDFLKGSNANKDDILNLEIGDKAWKPEVLTVDENIVHKIQMDFIEQDIIIVQGPPGTGKTFLMALLCSAFVKGGFRILVTALTNRALIELAEKEHMKDALSNGKVYKSSLTADENKNKKIKGIRAFNSLSQQRPQMLLTSYYVMSQIASKVMEGDHFDYVIIEEASQAFLSTVALARKLGKRCIIIGDIKQLEPIFHKEYPEEDPDKYHKMICGLKTISYYLNNSKQYILTDSYRLNQNSVDATNAFYHGKLKSKSNLPLPNNFLNFTILENSFCLNGGTSLKTFNLPEERLPSKECANYIIKIVQELITWNNKTEIAILSFNRDSVRYLQKEVYANCKDTTNISIDTIDRVQGMTTDFSIFFIPLEAFPLALQPNRFNVATSRARNCTLLISDVEIKNYVAKTEEISRYFEKVKILP